MRDDHSKEWKRIKQQILALCLRNGSVYRDGDHWTLKHITWLNHLTFKNAVLQETFEEYLSTFNYLKDKLERLDKRIEEFSQKEKYIEKVKRLSCLLGIKEHTALSLVVEVGDYNRFPKAKSFSAFLGLIPGEHTSDKNRNILSITKAGNTHLRRLLVEAAQCYPKGKIGYKSAVLKKRQQGNPPKVIAYADKANERLRRKAYHLILGENKKRNIAVVAIARELACFVWGLMTDHVD
jgi:transposase